jgi:hypothetical protein
VRKTSSSGTYELDSSEARISHLLFQRKYRTTSAKGTRKPPILVQVPRDPRALDIRIRRPHLSRFLPSLVWTTLISDVMTCSRAGDRSTTSRRYLHGQESCHKSDYQSVRSCWFPPSLSRSSIAEPRSVDLHKFPTTDYTTSRLDSTCLQIEDDCAKVVNVAARQSVPILIPHSDASAFQVVVCFCDSISSQ